MTSSGGTVWLDEVESNKDGSAVTIVLLSSLTEVRVCWFFALLGELALSRANVSFMSPDMGLSLKTESSCSGMVQVERRYEDPSADT